MKKTDKNIIIFIILGAVAVLMWTFMQYASTQKKAEESSDPTQIQHTQENDTKDRRENTSNETEKIIPEISATELNNKMNAEDITIIDARSRALYDKGHIRESIPIEDIDLTQIKRTVVLVTSNGLEDLIISHYRELSPTKSVYNLTGGISSWSSEGHALLSITNTPSFETAGKVQFVEPRDLDAVLSDPAQREDITIIDTRRSGNYEKGHISGAINIPLTELEGRYNDIPRTKKIYVYGADEDASFQSGVLLHDLRFIGTKTIRGGFAAWQEYNYPITTN